MDFGGALAALKNGRLVAREDWNGKKFLYFVDGSTLTEHRPPLDTIIPEGTPVTYCPHIDMRHGNGMYGVWSATQADILAEDWIYVNQTDEAESSE